MSLSMETAGSAIRATKTVKISFTTTGIAGGLGSATA